jgi:N-acetylglucosaminyldiphosphoundecaprenol N-acetyl-beta-D-mannosaminyltransferase
MPIEAGPNHDGQNEQARFLGVCFDRLDMAAMLDWLADQRGKPGFRYVVTPNVDHIVRLNPREQAATTMPFRQAYARAALRLCDSRILQRLAALHGINLPVCTGSGLTAQMMDSLFRDGDRVAVIGGSVAALDKLRMLYPAPEFLQHVPPMGALANAAALEAMHEFLRQADADFVLFCIGSPQSEIIAARMLDAGDVHGTALCVGASINFLTGDAKRAPLWMQRAGLEWLHRLLSEPRRMWRRYLVDDPRVFWLALTHRPGHDWR